jgi:hypothetical protein
VIGVRSRPGQPHRHVHVQTRIAGNHSLQCPDLMTVLSYQSCVSASTRRLFAPSVRCRRRWQVVRIIYMCWKALCGMSPIILPLHRTTDQEVAPLPCAAGKGTSAGPRLVKTV